MNCFLPTGEIMKRPDYLSEWQYFVWRHKKLGNLVFHFFSLFMFLIPVVGFAITPDWRWIIPTLLSIPVGYLGHVLYKDGIVRSRDFVHPNTILFLIAIFSLILVRRYATQVEKVKKIILKNDDKLLL